MSGCAWGATPTVPVRPLRRHRHGGAQLGFDIPQHTTRVGLFGTYAAMDTDDGSRGSWDADGGAGGYAEYWTDNFYLRGMISGGGYDGDQRRKVNDNNTASGNRSGIPDRGGEPRGSPIPATGSSNPRPW